MIKENKYVYERTFSSYKDDRKIKEFKHWKEVFTTKDGHIIIMENGKGLTEEEKAWGYTSEPEKEIDYTIIMDCDFLYKELQFASFYEEGETVPDNFEDVYWDCEDLAIHSISEYMNEIDHEIEEYLNQNDMFINE